MDLRLTLFALVTLSIIIDEVSSPQLPPVYSNERAGSHNTCPTPCYNPDFVANLSMAKYYYKCCHLWTTMKACIIDSSYAQVNTPLPVNCSLCPCPTVPQCTCADSSALTAANVPVTTAPAVSNDFKIGGCYNEFIIIVLFAISVFYIAWDIFTRKGPLSSFLKWLRCQQNAEVRQASNDSTQSNLSPGVDSKADEAQKKSEASAEPLLRQSAKSDDNSTGDAPHTDLLHSKILNGLPPEQESTAGVPTNDNESSFASQTGVVSTHACINLVASEAAHAKLEDTDTGTATHPMK